MIIHVKKMIFALLTLFCLPLSLAMAAESPRVVVSIKPLHSLVSGIMAGVGSPQLLVKKGSPHGYSLRPSEAKALAKADLVVWVGHELESFLEKPLQTLAKNSRQLELADQLKQNLLTKRHGGTWEAPAHHDDASHAHTSHADKQVKADLHLWLDPKMAERIIIVTTKSLIEIDPEHEQEYRNNSAHMMQKLTELDDQLRQKLDPVRNHPYLAFHAAYQYFEAAYGLNAVGSVTIDPERKPGAKRISEIRQKLQKMNARCVFSEPQFESRLVATIIEGTEVKTATLDPLGTDIPAGPEAYFQLMQRLADNLIEGLK
jgi:zinc transport system substrate-binding protein